MIHIMRYEINALQQLSASTCFKDYCRAMLSIKIKQASSVNRDKEMGTGLLNEMKRIGQNYVTIKQGTE